MAEREPTPAGVQFLAFFNGLFGGLVLPPVLFGYLPGAAAPLGLDPDDVATWAPAPLLTMAGFMLFSAVALEVGRPWARRAGIVAGWMVAGLGLLYCGSQALNAWFSGSGWGTALWFLPTGLAGAYAFTVAHVLLDPACLAHFNR